MHTVLDLGLVLEVRLQAGWEDNPSLMIFSWLLGDGRRPAKLMLKMRSEDFSLASKGFLYLKTYIFPFARSNFARIELQFGSSKLAERRQVQALTLKALKQHFTNEPTSQIPQQAGNRLWASRNRSKDERAKIRALVGVKEYCAQHINPMFRDLDWRGKLWIRSEQVLFHASQHHPHDSSLMLNDSKGDESGCWVDLQVLSRVLPRDKETIETEMLA